MINTIACKSRNQKIPKWIMDWDLWKIILIIFVCLFALLFAQYSLYSNVNHDEVEHAHVAYKILNGLLPYKDFYQNHWPAYWFILKSLIDLFPFSVDTIIAARGINIAAFTFLCVLGIRFLKTIRGGVTWVGISVFTWAMVVYAFHLDFHVARPDPIMTLLATIGWAIIPIQGKITRMRAVLIGLFIGLAISLTPKIIPLALVIPILFMIDTYYKKNIKMEDAIVTMVYTSGICLGLLPTLSWLSSNNLFELFFYDVFDLNNAVSKPWFHSLFIFLIPLFIPSTIGILLQSKVCSGTSYRNETMDLQRRHIHILLAIYLIAIIMLVAIARHDGAYNVQFAIVPLSIGFVAIFLFIFMRLRHAFYKAVFCFALLSYPSINIIEYFIYIKIKPNRELSISDLKEVIDLTDSGVRSCVAFAPAHPIFCNDISELNKEWDLNFTYVINNDMQKKRFQNIWSEGIKNTLQKNPDIILRKNPNEIWEKAEEIGLVSNEQINRLDSMSSEYTRKKIGKYEFWIRSGLMK